MREGDLMESTEYHTMCIRIYLESLPPLGAWRGVKTGSFIGGFKGPRVYWTPNRGTKRLRVPKKGKLRVPRVWVPVGALAYIGVLRYLKRLRFGSHESNGSQRI